MSGRVEQRGVAPASTLGQYVAKDPSSSKRTTAVVGGFFGSLAGGVGVISSSVFSVPVVILGGPIARFTDLVRGKKTQDEKSSTQQFKRVMQGYFKHTVRASGKLALDCGDIMRASLVGSDEQVKAAADRAAMPLKDQAFSSARMKLSLLELEEPPTGDSITLALYKMIEQKRSKNPGDYAVKLAASGGQLLLAPLGAAETVIRAAVQYPFGRQKNIAVKVGTYLFRNREREYETVRVILYQGVNRSAQACAMSFVGSVSTAVAHDLHVEIGNQIFKGLKGKTDTVLNVLNRLSPSAIMAAAMGDPSSLVTEIFKSIFDEIHQEHPEMPEEGLLERLIRNRLNDIVQQIPQLVHQALNRMPRLGALIMHLTRPEPINLMQVLFQGDNAVFIRESQVINAVLDNLFARRNRFNITDLAQAWQQFVVRREREQWEVANENPLIIELLPAVNREGGAHVVEPQALEVTPDTMPSYIQWWQNALKAIGTLNLHDGEPERVSAMRHHLEESWQGMQYYTGLRRDPNIGVTLCYIARCLQLEDQQPDHRCVLLQGGVRLLADYFKALQEDQIRGNESAQFRLFKSALAEGFTHLNALNEAMATELRGEIQHLNQLMPELFQN